MKHYMVKVMVEAYVWLDAENPNQARFLACDIAGCKAGKELMPVLSDIEACAIDALEVYEKPSNTHGCVSLSVDI